MPVTNGSIEIKSYKVGTNREANSINPFERFLYMEPKHPTATVKHLVVYFYANSVEVNDPNIGYQTPTTDYWVVGLAPVQDFDDMYKILLTEKPVYFLWAADSNGACRRLPVAGTEGLLGMAVGGWPLKNRALGGRLVAVAEERVIAPNGAR